MNVHSFARLLQTDIEFNRYPSNDTSGEWSAYMAKALHRVKDALGMYCCCHLDPEGHPDTTTGDPREQLWDMTWYSRHGARFELPLAIIEHENHHSEDEFLADFWKILAGFAPLRVMIGYTGPRGLETRVKRIHQLVRTQSWSFPHGTSDLIVLKEYAGVWRYLVRGPNEAAFRDYEEPESGFPIYGCEGSSARRIATVGQWEQYAAPARPDHWKDGHSAKELARVWCAAASSGMLPPAVQAALESHPDWRGFVPLRGLAEVETVIDEFAGAQRHNDLLVYGRACDIPVVMDIEGKVDEPFGNTIEQVLAAAENSPTSNRPKRIEWITKELGINPDDARGLRYQLAYGVAATVKRAHTMGHSRALFLVHELETSTGKASNLVRNVADLDRFVGILARASGIEFKSLSADGVVGPITIPGGSHIPAHAGLYIGKATTSSSS